MIRQIKKRDGRLVEFDPTKLNMWGEWAAGLGVDWSSVVLEACRKCYDGCTTEELHSALISACIDKETTAHLKMAGRLYIGNVYKEAFGDWRQLPSVLQMYGRMTAAGLWAEMDYTEKELEEADTFINHHLDLEATLTESKQIIDKYAVRDRVGKKIYETPQFVYMRMALGNMECMPKDRRMNDVKKLYEYLSQKKINAPSNFMMNLGTEKKHFASCNVSTTLDTLQSLAVQDHIAYIMTGASAGIGSHITSRSIGDKVRGGAIVHQGKIPYYRVQESVVAANKQGSRGGANTMHFNCLDPEIEELLRLNDVQQVKEKQVKGIDYSFGYNPLLAKVAAKNEDWMLVSYGEAPHLHELFYSADLDKFSAEYERVKADPSIKKKLINARDLAVKMFLTRAVDTGRIYEHNAYELNRHTPFKDTIYSSNLCQEIALPTKGYQSVAELYKEEEGNGEIGLCSLAAIAAGLVSEEEYPDVAYYAALMIDNVIDIMDYPFPQLKYTATRRRSIGVGITNLAYAMAKEGLTYTSLEGKKYIHRLAELHSWSLHLASVKLANERGACEWFNRTKYADGWLPIDTANKEIDAIVNQPLRCDWDYIREMIATYGCRFSVLEAHMPCESSSQAAGHTNGLYPIRAYKVIKTSGVNKNLFIAPELDTLKSKYELAWDIPTKDLVEVYAVVQKFTGQTISADIYLRIERDEQGKPTVSAKQLLQDWFHRVKLGVPTRYYINSKTERELKEIKQEEEEATCESCSL